MNKITAFFSDKMAITQIWHRAKLYFTCISSPWYLIMVLNMKKIHLVIVEECAKTDIEKDGLDPFLSNSLILFRQTGE